VLAALSALGGVLAIGGWIGDWLAPVVGEMPHEDLPIPAVAISGIVLIVVIIGIVIGWRQYSREAIAVQAPADAEVSWLTRAGRKEVYGNEINDAVAVRPVMHLTRALVFGDIKVVDGAVTGLADRLGEAAAALRRIQTGFVLSYALSFFTGSLFVTLAFLPNIDDFELEITPHISAVEHLAILIALGAFAMSVVAFERFDVGAGGYQLTEKHEWISVFGTWYSLSIDGLGLTLIMLATT